MIIRRRHTKNFTTIDNVLFDDERLAADEVGILAYLLSRPKDWEVRRPALQRRWGIGREAMKRIMFSWIRTGWCWPVRERAPNGTTFVIYEIRDQPGPELSDDEVRKALSLGSSDASADDSDVVRTVHDGVPETDAPPTGYPSLADPQAAEPYVVDSNILNTELTKDDSNQNFEREGLRSRERHAVALAQFKRRWPTIASDDQTKVDNAWFALTEAEGEAAVAGITPFLENQKRLNKKHPPAGFNYLGQKRWTLLEQSIAKGSIAPDGYARDSVEGKALACAFDIAGKSEAFFKIYVREGRVRYLRPVTPRMLALAQTAPKDAWPKLTRQQAAAWEGLMREVLGELARQPLKEGAIAPHPWPPKVDGTWSPTDAPETYCTEQDMADFH